MTHDAHAERLFWDAATVARTRPVADIEAHFEACVRPVLKAAEPVTRREDAELHFLDLGCGIGRLTVPAALVAPDALFYGVDASPEMIASLERRAEAAGAANVRAMVCDGRSLPEGCTGLDGAFSMLTFQHIPWRGTWAYIRAVARALFPGAVFRFQYVEGDSVEDNSHRFPEARVIDACERAGLKIEAVQRGLLQTDWTWVTARRPI